MSDTDPEREILKRVETVISDLGAGRIRGKPLNNLDRAVQSTKSDAALGRAINRGTVGDFSGGRGG